MDKKRPMGNSGAQNQQRPPKTAAAPVRRIRPTDRTIPKKIQAQIKDAQMYNDLREIENRLDATFLRKRYDLQDAVEKPAPATRTVRLFLSNSVSDQHWQSSNTFEMDSFDFDNGTIPSWTFRLDGAVIDNVWLNM